MLRLDNLNMLTRGERATLALPKVTYISKDDIELAKSHTEVRNPLLVNFRPPESAIEHAVEFLRGELYVLMLADLLMGMNLQ